MKLKPPQGKGPRLYGGAYPGVTDILKIMEKSYLDAWKRKVGEREASQILYTAAVFGTKVHAAAEHVAHGRYRKVGPDLKPYAYAVHKFLEKHVSEVIDTELSIWSPKLRYGGTLDLYCRLKDGSYAVVDWKTSKGLTREYGLQTAAYAMLCRSRELQVHRRLVVRIKKDKPGEYYCRHYEEHEEDRKTFLALVQVWWWKHGAATRKKLGGAA